ncbi:MAG TPA: anhydro-N-acetylmuramic acid kinase [Acidimicrobiia bacterium]|nr:anhydro-N-acetylmuramic acid kinase [Acidimicrobiia bacterium]
MIVIGLMSGTSMDGIDAAVADLALDGETLRLAPLGHETTPYPHDLAAALRAALPPNATTMETVCRLDTAVGQGFAAAAERCRQRHPGAALVVAHGQTVFHWVQTDGHVGGTLQIGRSAWIAERTGLPVVSDLRSADVAAGGQGAPLVSLFDVLLLGDDAAVPRAALNLGGIANLTVVGPGADPIAYDAGPANALIDAAVVATTRGDETCDMNGRRAARGTVDQSLLALLLDDYFVAQPPPKTTGKERYHHAFTEAATDELGRDLAPDDLIATLTAHAAEVAATECRRHNVGEVIASGGGTENPVLMKALAERIAPARLRTIDDLGMPSAAKEAYAFAVLGFLTWHGLAGNVPSCTGAGHCAVLGAITPGASALQLPPPALRPPSRLVITRG